MTLPLNSLVEFAPGAWYCQDFLAQDAAAVLAAVDEAVRLAPFRRLQTPGGRMMSAQMSNCGACGWISDARGYRYVADDPLTGAAWPAMPPLIARLGSDVAARCGYPRFAPDACLINRYRPGAGMSLHQDRDEQDLDAPIVSFSLGLPAVFLFGGHTRRDRPRRLPLQHGDVVVFGGRSRLCFHGILPIEPGRHALTGECRINLTLRRAL